VLSVKKQFGAADTKYGLAWGAPHRVAFAAAPPAIPRALPLLPSKLRYLRAPKNV
jgi:hypothetical protein